MRLLGGRMCDLDGGFGGVRWIGWVGKRMMRAFLGMGMGFGIRGWVYISSIALDGMGVVWVARHRQETGLSA